MSFSAPDPLSLAGLTPGLPAINQADLPASVRSGNTQAKNAYAEGLEFEQVLVQQLTQQLSNTVSASDPTDSSDPSDPSDSSDGTDGSDAGTSAGLLGSSSPASAYSSLIPQALTDSIISGGGLGVAQEIAQAIDPSINDTTGSTKS